MWNAGLKGAQRPYRGQPPAVGAHGDLSEKRLEDQSAVKGGKWSEAAAACNHGMNLLHVQNKLALLAAERQQVQQLNTRQHTL